MPSEQTDAIVLRTIDFSETSLILVLYTRDFGKLSVIAKGAKRPRSSSDGALDLLSVCRVVLIVKPSDTLDLLTEAKLTRRFRAAEKSLVRLYCGYYIAEIIRMKVEEGQVNRQLYDLLAKTISLIDSKDDALSAVIHFELQSLRATGDSPGTSGCVSCGGKVEFRTERVPFAYQLGGVLCSDCRGHRDDVAWIRVPVLDLISRIGNSDSRTSQFIEGQDYKEIRALLNRYISTHLGKTPRTQSLLPANWISH